MPINRTRGLPRSSIDGRAYTFTLTGNDGNGGITVPTKSFDVTVDNVTTVLTGSSLDGNNRVANPIRDTPITVQEDATFTVDVYASSAYGGDEDVDLGGSVGAQPRMDTHYGLRLWDSVNAAWVDIASSGTRANSSGGLITFNRDSGVVNWTPNDLDIGSALSRTYLFEVTHYDGNGTWDSEQFQITVNNTAPNFDPTMPSLAAPKDLVEDNSTAVVYEIPVLTDDASLSGVTYQGLLGSWVRLERPRNDV